MTLPVAGAVDQSRPRTLLDLVGNTPLIRLRRFERADARVRLYAKAEWKNPGGSVKDRAAAAMIIDGEEKGLLGPGKIILDATSGNTGIAYAMMGAARAYGVKLCMPANVTPERKRILRAVLEEIVATLTEERIELVIHWCGGDHTRLAVPRNRTGQHRWSSDADVRDLIRALARQQVDGAIARIVVEQPVEVGQVVGHPVVVDAAAIGLAEAAPVGGDDEALLAHRIHHELPGGAHVHPAVQQHQRRPRTGGLAPGQDVVAQVAHGDELGAGRAAGRVHGRDVTKRPGRARSCAGQAPPRGRDNPVHSRRHRG